MISTFDRAGSISSRFFYLMILVSVLLSLPALFSGYMVDDYFFTGGAFTPNTPFDYYNFNEENLKAEFVPWWRAPDFEVRFFRPLSSLTLYLDFTLFHGRPLWAHLHSLFWFVLLLIGAKRLMTDVLNDRVLKWTLVMYFVSEIHAWNVGWIASRHTVMGGAFVLLAAHAYLSWRRSRRIKQCLFFVALYLLGLLTSEIALSVMAVVVAYELFGTTQSWKARLKSMAPAIIISSGYLLFYKLMNFGTRGLNIYSDPFSQPQEFFIQLAPKAVSLVGALVLGVPASIRTLPGMTNATVGAGVVAFLLLFVSVCLCWHRFEPNQKTTIKWLSTMGILSLFPAIAGVTMGREFALFGIAVLGIASMTLIGLLTFSGPIRRRALPRALGVFLFTGTLVFSPLARVGMGVALIALSRISEKIGLSETGCNQGDNVWVFTGSLDIPIVYSPHFVATHQGRFFKHWYQLAITRDDIVLYRPAKTRFVLIAENRVVNTLLLRSQHSPFTQGDVIELDMMTVRILEISNGEPTRVELELRSAADLDTLCPLKLDRDVLTGFELPDVGERLTLAYTPLR